MVLGQLYGQTQTKIESTPQPYFRHYGVEDGLPSNEVYDVHQDQRGYIWLCTDNGVARYDGSEFVPFNTSDGLCSNVVFGCKEDLKKRLWFYSYTGEVCIYNPVSETFECPKFNKELSGLMNKNTIQNLVFDGDTVYVCATSEYVKLVYSEKQQKVLEKVSVRAGNMTVLCLSNGEYVVVAMLNSKQPQFDLEIKGKLVHRIPNIKFSGKLDYTLSYKALGPLVVMFGENALLLDTRDWTASVEKMPFVHTPGLKVHGNTLMCGSFNQGIWEIQVKDKRIGYKALMHQLNVSSTHVDSQGGIWASSQTDGLYYIPSRNIQTYYTGYKNNSETVVSMLGTNETIYFTTYGGALFKLNIKEGGKHQFISQFDVHSPVLVGKRNNRLYFRKGNELYWLEERDLRVLHRETKTETCVLQDLKGAPEVYARRDTLIIESCLPDKGVHKTKLAWKNGRILAKLKLDSMLWVGTLFDAFAINLYTSKIVGIGEKHGLSRLYTRQFVKLGLDTVLVVGSNGIIICKGINILKNIGLKDGLSSNKVLTVMKDGEKIWVGTANGLDVILDAYSSQPRIISITRLYGLVPHQVKQIIKTDRGIVTGGNKGIFVLQNSDSLSNKQRTDFRLRYFIGNGISYPVGDGQPIDLGTGDKMIRVVFSDFDFRNSLNRSYRYRLDSRDTSDWSYTHQNYFHLLSLPAGTYTLVIQRKESDGSWSASSCTQVFTIRLPFYKTLPFLAFTLITIIGITYFIFRRRIAQIRRMNDLNQKLVEMKLQALGMQLNPHFVFNALNSVSYHMTRNDVKSTLRFLSKFSKLMRLVFKNSKHSLINISEELKAVRLYVETETVRLGKPIEYKVMINEMVNPDQYLIPALLLQPFIENAIWHGISNMEKPGIITVAITESNDTLQVSIRDNGIGRKESGKIKSKQKAGRNSLEVIEERLALLKVLYKTKVELKINDILQGLSVCGTEVILVIPKIVKLENSIEHDQNIID